MTGALVVYESVFGDAKRIAMAIAEGLAVRLPVDVASARDAPPQVPSSARMLVVRGPDHAISMRRPATGEGAVRDHGSDIPDPWFGLQECSISLRWRAA